jgi:DNA polymerase III subunit epsilon
MLWYSQWVGERNEYHGDYKWQRLPGGDHSALGDCKATLEVIEAMAADNIHE